MPDKLVTFIDLLGFSNISMSDTFGAQNLLWNSQQILEERLIDVKSHPIESYDNPSVRKLAEQTSLNSCEMFLPGSDSIFMVSDDATKFIPQLSHFLLSCFLFTASEYAHPSDPAQPHKVTTKVFGKGGSISEVDANWYPTLFRGGIYYGDVADMPTTAIVNKEVIKTMNICGPAVVNAVMLEKFAKGPRLFCHEWVRDVVSHEYESYFVEVTRKRQANSACENSDSHEKALELLWPAFHFNPENDCKIEVFEINDLLIPAINLWLAYRSQCFGIHYFEFLRLVIRSALVFFNSTPCASRAHELIQGRLISSGLEAELETLMMNDL